MMPFDLDSTNNQKLPGDEVLSPNLSQGEKFQYQILLVEEDNNSHLGIKTTVYTGTKKYLKEKLPGIGNEKIDNFPHEGLDMKAVMKFKKKSMGDKMFINQYHALRRLLAARKLSQLIAETWLRDDQIEATIDEKTSLIDPTISSNQETEIKEEKVLALKIIRKLFLSANRPPDRTKSESSATKSDRQMIIKKNQESWRNICLNLLFCGQAYYKKGDRYIEVLKSPIISTYEASCFFSFQVVWNSFVGTVEEIKQVGKNQPPFYRVFIPYPQRPNVTEKADSYEDGLFQPILTADTIKNWAYSQDIVRKPKSTEFPFAKKKWNSKDGIHIEYVSPPYPYLPMSCSC
ncbi:hypothetical protein [Okeania sp. SIO1I7]|uniref:hypothetical protein n=1 Tax=Okeania sp. SIO1I7 TaxID=2607772 RepID=UPI0013FA5AB0|nr:hypothetical protein [Okeania sp. SIO1I7]NET28807.1 hypothetical protein [Okeania sp. SIO1I7]